LFPSFAMKGLRRNIGSREYENYSLLAFCYLQLCTVAPSEPIFATLNSEKFPPSLYTTSASNAPAYICS
jgi:hypothetical protein